MSKLTATEINDVMDLAECCVHDKMSDPAEREFVQRGLQKIRALAMEALPASAPSAERTNVEAQQAQGKTLVPSQDGPARPAAASAPSHVVPIVKPEVVLTDCLVGGDEGVGFLVWLKIGNQSFSIGNAFESKEKEEAEWSARMLREALARCLPSASAPSEALLAYAQHRPDCNGGWVYKDCELVECPCGYAQAARGGAK